MIDRGVPLVNDGVAVLARGDLMLIVYEKAARLHRTRWLFDRLDELAALNPDGILVLMVILPTADPPDGPTRGENSARLRRLGSGLRRLTTIPIGDAFRMSVVRAVMRAMNVLLGQSRTQFIHETIDEGIRRTLEAAGKSTPTRSLIVADLAATHAALGVEMPELTHEPTARAG